MTTEDMGPARIATVGDLRKALDYFEDDEPLIANDNLGAKWYLEHIQRDLLFGDINSEKSHVVLYFTYIKGPEQDEVEDVEEVAPIEKDHG